jgi:hypothetical protein
MAIIDIMAFPSVGICRTFRLNRRIGRPVPMGRPGGFQSGAFGLNA